ncbi:MAG TPA: hypothetical protein PLI79_13655, partial [Mycobacterium sp.]|nr:hypothetical protein [Mycobacterium sp.]
MRATGQRNRCGGQHGEAGGTAANFLPAGGKFNPLTDVRKQVWEPGDTWDSERLVVAAQADAVLAVHVERDA